MDPHKSSVKDALNLDNHNLHVWCANLDTEDSNFELLKGTLSDDELARAERFKFWKHQRRFIAARGILRLLIACYLHADPQKIPIHYNEFGKPYLPEENIGFNLAHSRDLALYAFCQTAEIGVDVEHVRSIEDAPGIAERFFAPAENETFQKTPVEDQNEVFLTFWTLKEAFIKAIGRGLSYPLNEFEVVLPENANPQLLINSAESRGGAIWTLFALKPDSNTVAAVAVNGKNWHLIPRKFDL